MKKLIWLTVLGSVTAIALLYLFILNPHLTGFFAESTKSVERDSTGKILKTVEVEQSGRTLWDFIDVLIVPVSLVALGFWLQQQQQLRTEKQTTFEKEIAEGNQKEEILQDYFDRLSDLFLDKDLLRKDKASVSTVTAESVIRARTLSILRRLGKDGERKSSVINFLLDLEALESLSLRLNKADLSRVNLEYAILQNADLYDADLSSANLSGADLKNAHLDGTDLSDANLSGANLSGADLSNADLKNANLSGANLSGANLKEEQLNFANLCNTTLPAEFTLDPNRDCKKLKDEAH